MAEEKKLKRKWNKSHTNALQLLVVGAVTGVFVGGTVTLYQVLMHLSESYAHNAYHAIRSNSWYIPLWLVALFSGAFIIGVIANMSSMVRGCAVPQVEGATRGALRFRWFRDATAMCASTLLSVGLGLSVDSEGTGMFIGACVGDGVGGAMRRNDMIRRYQMTGGACTGLAVVSNAPLTGIIFAFEEAHKRFTPEVFICSFISVIFGMLVRFCVFTALQMPITSNFETYVFQELPITYYPLVAVSALICGFLGVGLCKGCLQLRKLFCRIRFKKETKNVIVRIMIAVLIGGLASLIASDVMGGGHELINELGTLSGAKTVSVQKVFGLPLVWSLLIVLLLKMLCTGVNVGSGLPCGIFVPIIAMGACIGGVLNVVSGGLGADEKYFDLITMICMASFFVAVIRAPLTGIIMICEFTGSIAPLLPAVISVAIAYVIGDLFRTDGIYETLLERYEEEMDIHVDKVRKMFTVTVGKHSLADGREVRDVLWPAGARVREIIRGEETLIADGDTVLLAGDVLHIDCKTSDIRHTQEDLEGITK